MAGSGPLHAQTDSARIAELERKLKELSEEMRLSLGAEGERRRMGPDEAHALGLSPSAATVYGRRRGASFAGYGEMLYENYSASNESGAAVDRTTRLDFLRAVFYAGYRFNDHLLFNFEIEVEHANEVFVEFAYLDWRPSELLGFRAGMLLVPVGMVNELHEPSVLLGAERPVTEQVIIPSTWRANGVGVYGASGDFSYRAYLVNSLDGSGFSSEGLRGGRQRGIEAKASDLALAGALDFAVVSGLSVGWSGYLGDTGQGEVHWGGSAGGREGDHHRGAL